MVTQRVSARCCTWVAVLSWLAVASFGAPIDDAELPQDLLHSSTHSAHETDKPHVACDVDARTKAGAVIADCRHRGLTSWPAATALPMGVTELLLTGNELTTLTRADLAGLPQLRNLFVDHNKASPL